MCEFARDARWKIALRLSADAGRLRSVVQDRNAPQKHVWRAEIVLLTADGVGTNAIMRSRTGEFKTLSPAVGCSALSRRASMGCSVDKTRPSRIKKPGPGASRRPRLLVVALDARGTARGNDRLDARRPDVEGGGAQLEFGRTNRARPMGPVHRHRTCAVSELSNDPRFVDKSRDVVGLDVDPPAHRCAIVLSVDENSRVLQALHPTYPDCR